MLLLIVSVEIVIAYVTALYCARAIVDHLNSHKVHTLPKFREMQRSLSWILIIQAMERRHNFLPLDLRSLLLLRHPNLYCCCEHCSWFVRINFSRSGTF